MSQRSQVAKSGSRPIEQCSAACAEPGRSIVASPLGLEGVVGDGPPDGRGAQRALGEVERLLADHLAAGLTAHQERHDLVGDVDLAHGQPAVAPAAVVLLRDDRDVGGLASGGGVGRVGAADHGDVLLEVERLDQPGLAAVDVDRAGVRGRVRAAGVDGADHAAGLGLDQRHRRAAGRADVGEVAGPPPVGPEPAARAAPQQPGAGELVGHVAGGRARTSAGRPRSAAARRPRRTGADRGRRGSSGRTPSPRPAGRAAPRDG